jgi:hypothetical protein
MKRKRIRSLALVLMLAASSLAAGVPVVSAAFGDGHYIGQPDGCTMGDARALLGAFEEFAGTPLGPPPCQYRLFWDGDTMTFCEDDVILGGVVAFWAYKASGISRADAIADLDLITDRVWLDGVAQVLTVTAYKDANHPLFGRLVYNHRAFITQLPPGDHVSVYVQSYPGEPDFVSTIYLHVLPRALCP